MCATDSMSDDVENGYIYLIDKLRQEKIRLAADASRLLREALDAAKDSTPYLPVVIERLEVVLGMLNKE